MTSAAADIDVGRGRLHVRAAVDAHEQALPDGRGVYLSLYGDEIEQRARAFWRQWQRDGRDWGRAPLEPTDAAIHAAGHDVVVVRGAAATFPLFWSNDGARLRLTTALPVLDDEPLSRSGLVAAVAAAALHGSYEPNAFVETPLARWRRVRRASWARFRSGGIAGEGIVFPTWQPADDSRAAVALRVRGALDDYARSQSGVGRSLLEVSGGFDSTLAAAVPGRDRMQGVSVTFPYYEFRFEGAVQQATADFLGIRRTEVDGLDLFPYTPPEVPARFDEPSVFVTGIRHAERIAQMAAAQGAERLYTGHGGDQCFSTDLLARESLVAQPPRRGPFSPDGWRVVRRAISAIRDSPWTDRRLGTFVYDARADVRIKETFGTTMRTPFSDRAMFESALAWSHWCAKRGVRPDKSILAEAASDLLPEAILTRRGKVAYDGVWMRAYHRHGEHIARTFARAGDTLAHIGVSAGWLERRTRELAAWAPRSDREVLALYAVATWLDAWGLCRPRERTWSD